VLTLSARAKVNKERGLGKGKWPGDFLVHGETTEQKVAFILWGVWLKLCSQNYSAALMRSSFLLLIFSA